MTEGKLIDEINRKIRYMNAEGEYGRGKQHAINYFFKLIEEAKKDFPVRKLGTKGDWEIPNPMEAEAWFVKWFGEPK